MISQKDLRDVKGFALSSEDKKYYEEAIPMMESFMPGSTKKQRGYIYGLCWKLGIEERNLPKSISPSPDPRNLNIEQAKNVINNLLVMIDDETQGIF